ncbi:hypothetical protein [Nocardia iowensis]|uniref:Lipoprotein n=1 Tax=Nocardia iowensis TaxID=204891 RepID=A0ABX8RTJ0_NOCIO|nr:hypothetical protein [Nocardia iowensis]QXN92950.1 hypothetical protein KV110_07525 [Nocardia iowensis]
MSVAVLFLLAAALLSACSSGGSTATDRNRVADADTADCTLGGQAIAGLRDTFRQLSEQLDGLGPAASRGDFAEVKTRVTQGMRLSGQVSTTIDPVVDRMGSRLIGSAYRDVASAGGQLHTSLSDFVTVLDNGHPAQPVADSVTAALTALNTSMDRMRRACPAVFADAKGPQYGPPLGAR